MQPNRETITNVISEGPHPQVDLKWTYHPSTGVWMLMDDTSERVYGMATRSSWSSPAIEEPNIPARRGKAQDVERSKNSLLGHVAGWMLERGYNVRISYEITHMGC